MSIAAENDNKRTNDNTTNRVVHISNGDVQIIKVNPTMINTISFNFDVKVVSSGSLDVKVVNKRIIINKFDANYETLVIMSLNGNVSVTFILQAANTFPLNMVCKLNKDDLMLTLDEGSDDPASYTYIDKLSSIFEKFLKTEKEKPSTVGSEAIVFRDDLIMTEVESRVIDDYLVTKYELINAGTETDTTSEKEFYTSKRIKAVLVSEHFLNDEALIEIQPNDSVFVYIISSK